MLKTQLLIFMGILLIPLTIMGIDSPERSVRFKEIRKPYKTISPYIKSLLKMDQTKRSRTVAAFWQSPMLRKKGLPLVEADPMDKSYQYVTFLYRSGKRRLNIKIDVFGIYDEPCLGNRILRHLPGTNLYYRSYKMPRDICLSYRFQVNKGDGRIRHESDPLNPYRIPSGKIQPFSYSLLDLAPPKFDLNRKMESDSGSRIEIIEFPDPLIQRDRKIRIYLPQGYDPKRTQPYPVIYLFDAFIYLNRIEVPNILENLLRQKQIEPMVAVLVSSYRKSRDKTLPLKFDFKKLFVSKIVPMIRKRYPVSHLPEENIIGGISFGGLAASFIAFYHPDLFGKVLSQSGSFWRDQSFKDEQGEWLRDDWLIRRFQASEKKPLRFFLDWGLQEQWVLGSGRRFVRVLKSKGYPLRYIEFNGWHCWSNSRKTFADGLLYLLKKP